jgi:ribosome maturation factor RimP|tara:strand:- start:4634 stop:5074 length:441 start_codon:yes stop_codon:yes gene_type:complete
LKNEIAELIKPTILSMGYELWGLNVGQQNNSLKFTLYIDSLNGINIDDCEKVSNQVTHLLDSEEICGSEYVLEVSSPGFDRILITKDHFNKYLNEKVKVKLKWLVNNRKNIKGVIKSVTSDYVIINDDNESYEIKYDSIDSARLKI